MKRFKARKHVTCPRRMLEARDPLSFQYGTAEEGKDAYRRNHGLMGQPIGCTYCGSLPGGVFVDLIQDGWAVDGSDKSYKFYLAEIDGPGRAKFYTPHLNRAQAEQFLALWREEKIVVRLYVKPWLPSLSDDAPPWLSGEVA